MKHKMRLYWQYWIILIPTAVFSYGYTITHFAIGVDDTAMKLYFEEGLSVCTNRWTMFFLNRVLHLNIINWPTWLVEFLAVCSLILSFSLWCFLFHTILSSVNMVLPKWLYGFAAALSVSCPIMSEIWVYYLQNGISIGYGLTALSLLLFLKSLQHDSKRRLVKMIGSGLCLGMAIGCYETMMDCMLIGAFACFMMLHALSDKGKNSKYNLRFFPWIISGGTVLATSLLVRVVMHKILMSAYHLDNMAKYGVNEYNSFFGNLFVTPGAVGIVLKKMYLKYFVNAVVYLPITFLVLAWGIIAFLALYYTIKRKNLWVIICVFMMAIVPVLSSIAAGRVKSYHSAQFVPIMIMLGVICLGIVLHHCTNLQRRVLTKVMIVLALGGIIVQVRDINKWFAQDYDKFLEAKSIMTDVAETLLENYDIQKPIVVVGATMPSDELCRAASISMQSWKYRVITKMTDFDPTIKEKFHANYGDWRYYYADSPLLSVLTWAGNPFENCDLAASQQYTNFWNMIGYNGFTYAPTEKMIKTAQRIRENSEIPGYPHEGYIVDNGDMLIINLSKKD